MLVITTPGSTLTTRMPKRRTSCASASPAHSSAHFEAEEASCGGGGAQRAGLGEIPHAGEDAVVVPREVEARGESDAGARSGDDGDLHHAKVEQCRGRRRGAVYRRRR